MGLFQRVGSFFRGDSAVSVLPAQVSQGEKGASKGDDWQNKLTGLGVPGKDKVLGAEIVPVKITREDADLLYENDFMAARIVDRPVKEMNREGFELNIDGDTDKAIQQKIFDEFRRLDLFSKIEKGMKWGRIYGGAGLILGVQGQAIDMPLMDNTSIPLLEYVTLFDRYRLIPSAGATGLVKDPVSPYFNTPEFYQLQSASETGMIQKIGQKIHHTRIIRFEGIELGYTNRPAENYWGASIYQRLKAPIRSYQTTHGALPTLVQDFVLQILKLEELNDLITQGRGDLIMQRISYAVRQASILNAIVLRPGEEWDKKATPVTGLSDIVERVKDFLCSAVDIPHTILFNESPSGLGATGESEKKDWYDHIKSEQESEMRPKLERIVRLICLQKGGPTGGKIPKFNLQFVPLWQMDDKTKVEIREKQANTDQKYYDMGCIDSEEITKSRFGKDGYSIETVVDWDTREALENKKPIEGEEGAEEGIKEGEDPGSGAVEGGAPAVPGKAAANQTTSPQIALNGAQVTSLLEIIDKVAQELIPRETGIKLIEIAFALSTQNAEAIMGQVGKGFKPKAPEPDNPGGGGGFPPKSGGFPPKDEKPGQEEKPAVVPEKKPEEGKG